MVNDKKISDPDQASTSFEIGKRSITGTKGQSRFEILEKNKSKSIFLKPFFYIGFSFFIIIFFILVFFYVNSYVLHPMQDAVRVADVNYTRGDVVIFIRINNNQNPFLPDKNHFHHKLLKLGFSHVQSTAFIVLYCLIVISCSFFLYDPHILKHFLSILVLSIFLLPFMIWLASKVKN